MPLLPLTRFRIRCKTAPQEIGGESRLRLREIGGEHRRRLWRKTTLQAASLWAEAVGDSSDEENEAAAKVKDRGRCGQFVWPCPRRYAANVLDRKKQKWLIPEDLSKPEVGAIFQEVCFDLDHGSNLQNLHVFDEPHKKYCRVSGVRARHKHLIFKMREPFAHVRMQKELAKRGVHGHFSFNLIGYGSYLRYCLMHSAKKLPADLDRDPWSWPDVPISSLLELCTNSSPQMDARNGQAGMRGRKRKLMTFSEVTDAFVEKQVKTEKQAWELAKSRKLAGDDTLYNTLGDARCVASLVSKVRRAWDCEAMSSGTLHCQPDFNLSAFVALGSINMALSRWILGEWKTKALILSGDGGLGKTELACAMVHAVAPCKAFHFLNKIDRLRDVVFSPGEGLVIDETFLANLEIDDAKGLLDIVKHRDIACRNKDGHIPRGTPRVFTTNWSWDEYWPREAFSTRHQTAIRRRVTWVDISQDLRRAPAVGSGASITRSDPGIGGNNSPAEPLSDFDEPDVFGFGGSMNDH